MSTIWDEFQSNTDENGDFPDSFKFEEPGASIAGTITTVKVADFGGGDRKPELYICDAAGKTCTVKNNEVFAYANGDRDFKFDDAGLKKFLATRCPALTVSF